ncbi:MAG: hypothetical protein IKP78_03160 [Ruminococcus sp.]|nr:hypothetical protein [Ruminococcus sp.]
MDEMKNMKDENTPKKGGKALKELKIAAFAFLMVSLCIVGGLFGMYLLFGSYFGGYVVDSYIGQATSCRKATDSSIVDYYEEQKKEIPADKEYTIYATFGPDGLVSEPCEFFPESVNQNYFDGHSRYTYNIIMKYKDGKFSEMWMSRKELTDDVLVPYDRYEMQDMYGPLKRDRDLIVYVGYRSELKYFH